MFRRTLMPILLALAGPLLAQGYSPAQAAWLKSEVKRAQERFVAEAAAASGVPADKIRQWVPSDGSDVPPRIRVLPALERERGAPLDPAQRARINAAETEKIQAIEHAKQEAHRR